PASEPLLADLAVAVRAANGDRRSTAAPARRGVPGGDGRPPARGAAHDEDVVAEGLEECLGVRRGDVAHLVPVEAHLPLAESLTQEMEFLRVNPPVLAGHLDGVGFIGPEQPKVEVFEEEARVVIAAKAPDVPVLLELAISQSGRMGPVGILGQALNSGL